MVRHSQDAKHLLGELRVPGCGVSLPTPELRETLCGHEARLASPEPLFDQLLIGDIDARADIATEHIIRTKTWNSGQQHPTVLSIGPPNPDKRTKLTLGVNYAQELLAVLGMQAGDPAIASS